ncbi:beta-1,3-galactosyltransferase 9 [Ascaphus truei]|uniref:beta-1,3-galactosyltransferase 9 n=1 Tax=Ascaphus truei TaxID=8439 RepID=UPI003F591EA2
MQVSFCRLRTHQWCFILCNIVLFHALLFGADFIEEYFLQSVPVSYTDAKFVEIRDRARKLDMHPMKDNISKSYVISGSDVCSDRDVFLLSVIFSSPENKTRRDLIRHTWANVTEFHNLVVASIFALGRPVSETTQSEILDESQIHKDIIEGSFIDAYHNETLKTVMMMEWIVTFCPNAKFILKTDEQMFVNVKSLADYLQSLKTHPEDIYTGRVIHQNIPDRDPQSLNFVPMASYSENYYPDYCSGTAFVMSQDVARKVYIVSEDVTTLVPSDTFIGICAQRAGVVPIHSSRFSGTRHIRYNRCCYKFIFSSSTVAEEEEGDLSIVWSDMNKGEDCSVLETYYGLVSCKVWTYLDKFKHFNMEKIKKGALSF